MPPDSDNPVAAWHKEGGTELYHSKFIVAPENELAVMVENVGDSVFPDPAERILLHALAVNGNIDGVPVPLVFYPDGVTLDVEDDNYIHRNGRRYFR